jgi:Ca2+-binding EF-hand superfamily protein
MYLLSLSLGGVQVISAFDMNSDGSISFDEFLRGIRGNINKRRREIVMAAFDVADKDHSGVITLSDVAAAYDASQHPEVKAGKKTAAEVLNEFMSQWDRTERDGMVSRDEFLEYYKDVSASIDDDDYFELVIRNAWHISGGEGWAGAEWCRAIAC